MGKISRGIHKACEFFLAVSLLAVVLVLTANVILRYAFSSGLVWAEEVSRFIVAWATFVGAACCVTEGSDITIDSIVSLLSKKGQRILAIIVALISVVFIVMFIRSSGMMTLRAFQNGQMATSFSLPLWVPYLSMPVGGALTLIRLAEKLVALIKQRENGLPENSEV